MYEVTKQTLHAFGLLAILVFTVFPIATQAQHSPEALRKMATNPELSIEARLARSNQGIHLSGNMDDEPGAFIDVFASGNTLDIPLGITFGPADGHLYVASFGTDAILRYDGATGEFIDVFVPTGTGMLDAPTGLRFGPDNHLYVSSRDTDQVLRYDGETGAFVDVFAEDMNLDAPEELVFGADGHLYVASRDTDKILRFNGTTGDFVDVFAEDATNLTSPVGLAWGPDGNLYTSSHAGINQVVRFNGETGEFIDVFSKNGGLSAPNFIVFGPTGDLFVGNGSFTDQVVRFDGETGEFKDLFIPTAFGGLLAPGGHGFWS